MKNEFKTTLAVLFALALVATLVPRDASSAESRSRDGTQAQSEKTTTLGVLDIEPWSVDSGGGESTGGTFAMVAAVGQHDTGLVNTCGRVLDGGVWSASVNLLPLFCDGFESGGTGFWGNVNPMTEPTDDSQTPGGA